MTNHFDELKKLRPETELRPVKKRLKPIQIITVLVAGGIFGILLGFVLIILLVGNDIEMDLDNYPANYNHPEFDAAENATYSSYEESNDALPPVPKSPEIKISVVCSNYATQGYSQKPNLPEVLLEVTNLHSRPTKVWADDFVLNDSNGNSFNTSNDFYDTRFEALTYSEELNPGIKKHFSIVFEIPETGQFSLVFKQNSQTTLNPGKSCLSEALQAKTGKK